MSECKRTTCHSSTTITYFNLVEATDPNFYIVIVVPQSPWTYIDHFPSISMVTYIVYTMGAFGTWTGLNILSLNPFSLLLKKKKKEKAMRNAPNITHPTISVHLADRNRSVVQPHSIQFSRSRRNVRSVTK